MANDAKFGVVLDQRSKLGADEPVFVIRGRDIVAEHAIYSYAELAEKAGADGTFVQSVRHAAASISMWQSQHPDKVKVPD